MYNMSPQSHVSYELCDNGAIVRRINVENGTTGEGSHALQHNLERRRTDLRCDGEEELATFPELALDPHVALHERHETF